MWSPSFTWGRGTPNSVMGLYSVWDAEQKRRQAELAARRRVGAGLTLGLAGNLLGGYLSQPTKPFDSADYMRDYDWQTGVTLNATLNSARRGARSSAAGRLSSGAASQVEGMATAPINAAAREQRDRTAADAHLFGTLDQLRYNRERSQWRGNLWGQTLTDLAGGTTAMGNLVEGQKWHRESERRLRQPPFMSLSSLAGNPYAQQRRGMSLSGLADPAWLQPAWGR